MNKLVFSIFPILAVNTTAQTVTGIYDIFQGGYSEGSYISGTLSVEDINQDGFFSSTEISSFSFWFSGNNNIPSFFGDLINDPFNYATATPSDPYDPSNPVYDPSNPDSPYNPNSPFYDPFLGFLASIDPTYDPTSIFFQPENIEPYVDPEFFDPLSPNSPFFSSSLDPLLEPLFVNDVNSEISQIFFLASTDNSQIPTLSVQGFSFNGVYFDLNDGYYGGFPSRLESSGFVDQSLGLMNIGRITNNNPIVPEPSTYAVIFGTLALGFVAMRKRNT